MRILQVISGIEPENGGPTAALAGHCRALVAAGADVSIVATWKLKSSFDMAGQLERDGIPVTLLGPTRAPFRRHPAMASTLTAAIARHDVVHIHAMWEAIEHRTAVLCRRANRPYVWTPHGMLDQWNMRRNHWFKRACLAAYLRRDLNAAAALHVATEFEARQVARLKLNAPLFIEGFGLDASLLNADIARGQFRSVHGIADHERVVLFLGRIQRGKGLEVLIPALAATRIPARLVIAGPDEGDYRRDVLTLIAKHGLSDRVIFVGMITGEAKLQAIVDADLLAAPSEHENFGIAVAEAIALGTPVVVSDQVGLAAHIEANHLGRVAALNVRSTTAALDAVTANDAAGRGAARAFARTHLAWPAIARRWVVQYANCVRSAHEGLKN